MVVSLGTAKDNDLQALGILKSIGKHVDIGRSKFRTIVKIQKSDPPNVLECDGDQVHRL